MKAVPSVPSLLACEGNSQLELEKRVIEGQETKRQITDFTKVDQLKKRKLFPQGRSSWKLV